MGRKSQNKKNRVKNPKKESSQKDSFLTIFILIILFLIPFFISYFITNNFLERKMAVSPEEEAEVFQKIFTKSELNNLYSESKESLDKKNLKDKVIILGYHQIRDIEKEDSDIARLFITPPEIFEEEMRLLKKEGYTSISLSDYIDYLNNRILNKIPEKSVVITFDDGYSSQYKEAFSILEKYGFTATFFLYMDCIDKYPACLTSSEIKKMIDSGHTLGNHTLRHLLLTDYKESIVEKEILENERLLVEKFGKENIEKILAYPYGAQNEKIEDLLKKNNYIGAVGVTRGAESNNKNNFNLKRYLLGDKIELFLNLFDLE